MPEECGERERDRLAIDVEALVDGVGLDGPVVAADSGARADVDDAGKARAVGEGEESGIDAVGGEKFGVVVERDIGGRESESAPDCVAVDDGAVDGVGASEERGCLLDVGAGEGLAHLRRADLDVSVEEEGVSATGIDTLLTCNINILVGLEGVGAEAVVIAQEQISCPDFVDEPLPDELAGGEVGELACERNDEKALHAAVLKEREEFRAWGEHAYIVVALGESDTWVRRECHDGRV